MKTKKCHHCGTNYAPNSNNNRYCSEPCRAAVISAKKKVRNAARYAVEKQDRLETTMAPRSCVICQETFQPQAKGHGRKICFTPSCADALKRQKVQARDRTKPIVPKTCMVCSSTFTPLARARQRQVCFSFDCVKEKQRRRARPIKPKESPKMPSKIQSAISTQLTTKRPRKAAQQVAKPVVAVEESVQVPVSSQPNWNTIKLAPLSKPFQGEQRQFGKIEKGKFVFDFEPGQFWG